MIKCKMILQRLTKNKALYSLKDGDTGPESVYIEKDKLPVPIPTVIEISVDIAENID